MVNSWYCNYGNGSSTGYYAVAQWAALHVYAAGAIVRQLAAPATGSERCFRTAAGGTSGAAEPTWTLTAGGTTAGDGTVTWTEVTGNATYNWSAPYARLQTAVSSAASGDTVYVASIHAETQTGAMAITSPASRASPIQVICVTASGSVPPVAADVRTSATCTDTDNGITVSGPSTYYGVTFTAAGTLLTGNSVSDSLVLNSCALVNTSGSNIAVQGQTWWNNTPVTLANGSVKVNAAGAALYWSNTPSAVSGTMSARLLDMSGGASCKAIIDGCDLSGAGSGVVLVGNSTAAGTFASLRNCRINASVTAPTAPTLPSGQVNLEITDSGSGTYRQESYQFPGTLTTETTFVRSGGASNGVTPISWKIVTNASATLANPFVAFQIAIWNTALGSSKTATIEIENGGTTLTNADVWVDVEYLGSASYPLASLASSQAAPLASTNIPTSSVTWLGSLGSAVKQYLQVTFTPNLVGYVRATVKVAKASQTLYVDPVITLA